MLEGNPGAAVRDVDPIDYALPPLLDAAGVEAVMVITIDQDGNTRFRACHTRDTSSTAKHALDDVTTIYRRITEGLGDADDAGEAALHMGTPVP